MKEIRFLLVIQIGLFFALITFIKEEEIMKTTTGSTTVTGFSKAGFSCCSRWKSCNMGETCSYEMEDPEAKEFCRCYQRKHSRGLVDDSSANKVEQLSDFSTKQEVLPSVATEDEKVLSDPEQLTLF